jgi:hypothetical protein
VTGLGVKHAPAPDAPHDCFCHLEVAQLTIGSARGCRNIGSGPRVADACDSGASRFMISAMLGGAMVRHRWLSRFVCAFGASALISLVIDGHVDVSLSVWVSIGVVGGFLIEDRVHMGRSRDS